jgi:hypothetical protein
LATDALALALGTRLNVLGSGRKLAQQFAERGASRILLAKAVE